MRNKQELIIPVDPNLMHGAAIAWSIWIMCLSLLLGCYGVVRYYLTGFSYYLLLFLLIGPIIFFAIMVLLMVVGHFSFPKTGEPMAILNQEGVWTARFGLIPWPEITEFGPYAWRNNPPEVIGIRVRDNDNISKQSSIAGKLDFFWAKWMGYPPIRITGIALTNDEVITFAKQFMVD